MPKLNNLFVFLNSIDEPIDFEELNKRKEKLSEKEFEYYKRLNDLMIINSIFEGELDGLILVKPQNIKEKYSNNAVDVINKLTKFSKKI